jgi:hypothetical protein
VEIDRVTTREVVESLMVKLTERGDCEIVGQTLIFTVGTQRFYIEVNEDKHWRPRA